MHVNFSFLSAGIFECTLIFRMYGFMNFFNHRKRRKTKKQALYFNTDVGFHYGTTSLKVDVL